MVNTYFSNERKKKTSQFFLLICCGLFLYACNSSQSGPDYPVGQGVEIYLAKYTKYDYNIDYSAFNLDTVQLLEQPIVRYNEIKKYDLQQHIAELTVPVGEIEGFKSPVHRQMFIVTVDNERMYCGFTQPLLLSSIPYWVMITEPIGEEASAKALKISFSNQDKDKDPRANNKIVERLRQDGKLK